MVAINFKGRFTDMVEAGTKRQTIRRKARCKPGDRFQLYTGQRTAACRKLIDPDPICEHVGLSPKGITLHDITKHPRDWDDFARADGLRDYDDMLAWFTETYGSPFFQGVVIRWTSPPSPNPLCLEGRGE